ncbi:MAG: 50S ribosomal protein L2 [Candidatus Nealsonbacteria bacterium]
MLKNQGTKEDFKMLTKKEPEKRLLRKISQTMGRGASGRISVRHKGGGAKRLYRLVDFGQEKMDMEAKVVALEYDPYRTAFIMLLEYKDKDKRYRLAPKDIQVKDSFICQETGEIKTGNRMKLKNVPVGTAIYNVELEPGRGGKMMRGAGTSAKILSQEGKYAHLQMPSSEIRQVNRECFASIGEVSRSEHFYLNIGKAGRSRHMGRRPTVRGSAMIPPDHPHGGGEGRAPIGMPYPKTPWGKHALGVKTRNRASTDKYIIQRRNKKKKK